MDQFLHTGLVADPICKDHATGPDHPESPERYDAACGALCRSGLMDVVQKIPCRSALDSEIILCHTPEYLALVKNEIASGRAWLTTGDTEVCPRSFDAALYTVGGVLNAVDAVCQGNVKNAFCLVRPPGHHATADRGMGFCIFNNVAIAARHAQINHNLERIVIIDWDVHHGNGTQDIFYEDGSVFYFSIHQSPLYPGTGAASETGTGRGRGMTMNVPLRAGAGRREAMFAFESGLFPAMEKFKPDMIFISAGFDSRIGDPLGNLTLTDDDYYDLTGLMVNLAQRYAQSRLVSVLEGGYNLSGLASAVTTHVRRLTEA